MRPRRFHRKCGGEVLAINYFERGVTYSRLVCTKCQWSSVLNKAEETFTLEGVGLAKAGRLYGARKIARGFVESKSRAGL